MWALQVNDIGLLTLIILLNAFLSSIPEPLMVLELQLWGKKFTLVNLKSVSSQFLMIQIAEALLYY